MPRFLIAIHHPDNYDASAEDASMRGEIDALNDEMVEAEVRVFVGGLKHAKSAVSLVPQANGDVGVSEQPYLPTTEHVGGFWVLECKDMDEALEWGRKAVKACRAPVEVREFH